MSALPLNSRAQKLRLDAGDSVIDLSIRLNIPALFIHRMERGEEGSSDIAYKVIGHYRGRANEKAARCPIGLKIQSLRNAAGHSQTDLARHIGVKPALIWKVETRPQMSRRTCHKIAEFYGVPAVELQVS
jgi:DNA-binding XRE family transcriptional regulator